MFMHARFHTAFAALPENLSSALEPFLRHDDFPAMLTAADVAQVKQATGLDDDALAFALLPLAAACSVTPISHFHVGAIARGTSGNLYFGANMEFAGAPMQQTVHAEQSAVTHAWLRGETRLASITVNYTPCGHCRQFLNELTRGTDGRLSALHLHFSALTQNASYLPQLSTALRSLPEDALTSFTFTTEGKRFPPAKMKPLRNAMFRQRLLTHERW